MTTTTTPPQRVDLGADPMDPTTVRIPPLPYRPTLPCQLAEAVRRFGDREFVVDGTGRHSFADIEQRSRRIAGQLVAGGVGKASRVGMLAPNGATWASAFIGAARAGALVVPLSTFSAPGELRRALRHGDIQCLIVPPTMFGRSMEDMVEEAVPELRDHPGGTLYIADLPFLRAVVVLDGATRAWATDLVSTHDDHGRPTIGVDLLEQLEAEITPADHFVMIYTSGTTSEPKGVVHTHGAQIRHGARMAEVRGLFPGEKTLAVMPFFWVGGLTCAFLPALHAGTSLICQEKFEPSSALDLIEREQPDSLAAWADVRQRLLHHATYPDRNLEGIGFLPPVGSPEPDTGLLHNSLGMTETSGPHTAAFGADRATILSERHRGSFGPRVPYVEHRIADPETNATLDDHEEGEVCIRGYSVMVGLYKKEREEVFDADGWYHTNDRGHFVDDFLIFTGRINEMIKTSGANVSPREVEVALASFPGVELPLVFGLPDAARGEIVVAGVVVGDGAELDIERLADHARNELSPYKVPRHFVVLRDEEVPFLASGKPDRRYVRDLLARRLA